MSDLAPCPFCGGEASTGTVRYSSATIREQNWGQDTFHYINCIICGSNNRGLVGFATQDKAATHWNKRSDAAADERARALAEAARVDEREQCALAVRSVSAFMDDMQRNPSKVLAEAEQRIRARGQAKADGSGA